MIRHFYLCLFAVVFIITNSNAQTTSCENCWIKTELYFGLSIPSGGIVSQRKWKKFVRENISPEFPDGSTILKATGQWMDTKSKTTLTEPSRVLIVLYPLSEKEQKNKALEKISQQYIDSFEQQAILRVDDFVDVKFYSK